MLTGYACAGPFFLSSLEVSNGHHLVATWYYPLIARRALFLHPVYITRLIGPTCHFPFLPIIAFHSLEFTGRRLIQTWEHGAFHMATLTWLV